MAISGQPHHTFTNRRAVPEAIFHSPGSVEGTLDMHELDPLTLLAGFVLTWGIGLAPPLLIRYAILRRPMGKGSALGTCAFFWLFNIILFTALGSQSKTHAALTLVAFVSYWLLRRSGKAKAVTQ